MAGFLAGFVFIILKISPSRAKWQGKWQARIFQEKIVIFSTTLNYPYLYSRLHLMTHLDFWEKYQYNIRVVNQGGRYEVFTVGRFVEYAGLLDRLPGWKHQWVIEWRKRGAGDQIPVFP